VRELLLFSQAYLISPKESAYSLLGALGRLFTGIVIIVQMPPGFRLIISDFKQAIL
jgi:hypothetical protein